MKLIFKAVSLAMGIGVIALSIMNEIDTNTVTMMLAVGLGGVGAALLMERGE